MFPMERPVAWMSLLFSLSIVVPDRRIMSLWMCRYLIGGGGEVGE